VAYLLIGLITQPMIIWSLKMKDIKQYQLWILIRALRILLSNYDEYDLEELMYTPEELESEIILLQEKIETSLKQKV
jgi:hypothetical protein